MTITTITEKLGGAGTLATAIESDLDLIEVLQEGFPLAALDAAIENGTLTRAEAEALVIPRRTWAHRKQKGQRLTEEESDRLARIARIVAFAEETLQDEAKAHRWLRKPNGALGGAVPLALLSTGEGAVVVEDLLGQIAHGIIH
jgi:putative toxin-antitoxin system antitoxin component (TIGR02293 family)